MIDLYKPALSDLWFRQAMLADAATMAYNHAWGGVIDFPKEAWAEWYEYWVERDGGRRFYRYVTDEQGAFVGEVAYHYDDELGGAVADVIVLAKYRGMGYGGQALDALCAAAKQNDVPVLYDDIAVDNPAVSLFLRHGFGEERRTADKIILKKAL